MVICLQRGADLHMAQLMPLPLTVSCFSKIQIGLPFPYWLTRVVLDKGPLNGCVCVCMLCYVTLCNIVFIIPAKAFARDYVITGVGLSVCLFVCLLPR